MANDGAIRIAVQRLGTQGAERREEAVAEEVAVALSYNGISHAVMMATPLDLEDFALGFSLTEGIVADASEVFDIEVEPAGRGIEVRLRIAERRMAALAERRRSLAGRTGCGLCGVDSLAAALRPVHEVVAPARISAGAIRLAMAALPAMQTLNRAHGALHATGWVTPDGALVAVREDVGRHNALDKLAGALAQAARRSGRPTGPGFVLATSRCSYEMVQKAAAIGASAIAAVSAPTSLAIETAQAARIALAAFVRDDRLTLYAGADLVDP